MGGHYGYGYARPYYGGYAGWYGKRSAEAEPEAKADPWLTYGYGLGHHYGYAGYPYTYRYYGKRSAEAEPEAKPYYYGGYYGGYARPYYGGYGYRAYWG